jgi:branched-chain amino acid aminotransferase
MLAAKKAGYAITLHLDSGKPSYSVPGEDNPLNDFSCTATRTLVDEFSTSNCLLLAYEQGQSTPDEEKLKKPTLYVPESPSILKSITSKSIAQIAEKIFGWKVQIAPVAFDDVKVSYTSNLP